MRKLLFLILLLPALCWGQYLDHTFLWEAGSSYVGNQDTCAVISDTTAADSAVFYIGTGLRFTGYGPTFQMWMDSTLASDVGTLSWADSVTVKLYPRVPNKSGVKEPDGRNLKTLWNDPITMTLNDGTSCSNWSPTAEEGYLLGHSTYWQGRQYYGVTLVVSKAATDALLIMRLGIIKSMN